MLRWKNFLNSVVPSLRSIVTFHSVNINKKLRTVKEVSKIIYESFSEILNYIALLGAKFVYSFPWELFFCFETLRVCLNNQNVIFNTLLTMTAVTLAVSLAV